MRSEENVAQGYIIISIYTPAHFGGVAPSQETQKRLMQLQGLRNRNIPSFLSHGYRKATAGQDCTACSLCPDP